MVSQAELIGLYVNHDPSFACANVLKKLSGFIHGGKQSDIYGRVVARRPAAMRANHLDRSCIRQHHSIRQHHHRALGPHRQGFPTTSGIDTLTRER